MMIVWQDSLSVGMPEIDQQHQDLFAKFNALLEAWLAGEGRTEVGELFDFLDSYVLTHFADEENLMRQIGFPALPDHQEVHQAFVRQVSQFKERLITEGPTPELVSLVSMTMTGWLIKHISGMDRAIGTFYKEQCCPAA